MNKIVCPFCGSEKFSSSVYHLSEEQETHVCSTCENCGSLNWFIVDDVTNETILDKWTKIEKSTGNEPIDKLLEKLKDYME